MNVEAECNDSSQILLISMTHPQPMTHGKWLIESLGDENNPIFSVFNTSNCSCDAKIKWSANQNSGQSSNQGGSSGTRTIIQTVQMSWDRNRLTMINNNTNSRVTNSMNSKNTFTNRFVHEHVRHWINLICRNTINKTNILNRNITNKNIKNSMLNKANIRWETFTRTCSVITETFSGSPWSGSIWPNTIRTTWIPRTTKWWRTGMTHIKWLIKSFFTWSRISKSFTLFRKSKTSSKWDFYLRRIEVKIFTSMF